MSGLAAQWTRENRLTDPAVIAAMTASMSVRGPDGCATWRRGPVAFAHLAFASTPEALAERQPLEDCEAELVLVLDGRLDNRDDLHDALGGTVDRSDGDSAYVLAAYRRWGVAAVDKLIGDFALVIWDAREQRIVCARDVMGVRPLCYATTRDGQLLIASELRALLATRLVSADINEARALEHLVDRGQHRTETLYRSIHRLPPAHVLVATRDEIRIAPYWHCEARYEVRHKTALDYAEHARALFGRVVRAQARSHSRVGVLLSGGLDSSAVAAIARAEGIECDAITVRFPDDAGGPLDSARGRPDECAYASAVAQSAGLPWSAVDYRPEPYHWYAAQSRDYRDLPDYPNGSMLNPARRLAASRGIRVLLTGVGGDEWFTGSPYRYADWLRGGAMVRALRQAAGDVVRRGWHAATREAALCGVWPVLTPGLRSMAKRILGGSSSMPAMIDANTAARVDLARRVAVRVVPDPGETFARADTRLIACSGFQVHSDEVEDRAATRAGVEQRNPFYDRRIIEFALGLPEEQRSGTVFRKVILRNATAGLLPDVVRLRRDKAEFSNTYRDALERWPATDFSRLRARGWIDAAAVDRLRRDIREWRAAGDPRYWSVLGPFWMLHALDTWLEHARSTPDVTDTATTSRLVGGEAVVAV